MDLTEFLLARIAEDQRNAGISLNDETGPGTWHDWVLRECEAKRRIVEEHQQILEAYPNPKAACCSTCSGGGEYPGEGWPCATMRALAAVWSDHADYDEAWKP